MKLHRLNLSPFDYFEKHGKRSVCEEVRRWVAHPKSVRECGDPLRRGGYTVELRASAKGPRLAKLRQCKNRFVDPYCSGWWRAELADRTERAVLEHLAEGWSAYLLVHTISHQRGDSLKQVFEWGQQAWNHSRRGRNALIWGAFKWLRAADIVVGGRNGPHPHTNSTVLVPPGVTSEAFRSLMSRHSATWATSTLRAIRGTRRLSAADTELARSNILERGLVVVPMGVTLEDIRMHVRYGVKDLRSAVIEIHDNVHRTTRSKVGGFTLMELACMAHAGQDDAGRLLAASAADLYKKRSYTTSANWTWATGDLGELDEDENAEAVMVDDLVLGYLATASYERHRAAIDRFLDSSKGLDIEASITAWHECADRLSLEVIWFDNPVPAADL